MITRVSSVFAVSLLGSCIVLPAAAQSPAQEQSPKARAVWEGPDLQPPPNVDYDSEPPYTFYERQWNRRFPAPYRQGFRREYYPHGRPYYPRRYYGAPPAYRWSPYDAAPYYAHEQEYFDDGYTEGFHDGRRLQKWDQQAELGLNSYLKAMQAGVGSFRVGDYSTAARQFMLAAELNHGDAACRLHVVHAFTALGHYSAAVPALRRALQLQPKLAYLPLDIRTEYGVPGHFDTHLARLQTAVRSVQNDAGLWLLLGYYQFFSGAMPDAARSLGKAAELAPDDSATRRLLDVARLTAPPAPQPEPAAPAISPPPRPQPPAPRGGTGGNRT